MPRAAATLASIALALALAGCAAPVYRALPYEAGRLSPEEARARLAAVLPRAYSILPSMSGEFRPPRVQVVEIGPTSLTYRAKEPALFGETYEHVIPFGAADPRAYLDPHGRGYVVVDLLGHFPGFVDPRGTAVVFPDEADARAAIDAIVSLRDGAARH